VRSNRHCLDNDIVERVCFAGSATAGALGYCDLIAPLRANAALSSAAAFSKYRTLKSDFLDRFDASALVLLGSQQPLPAMG
jgi:hypothetical protein